MQPTTNSDELACFRKSFSRRGIRVGASWCAPEQGFFIASYSLLRLETVWIRDRSEGRIRKKEKAPCWRGYTTIAKDVGKTLARTCKLRAK